jgi:hypothetical protein
VARLPEPCFRAPKGQGDGGLSAGEIGEGLRAPSIRPVYLALDLPSMTDRSVADRHASDGKRYRAYRLIWEILT